MRIFVINLARAADRLRKMQQQFSSLDLTFERIEAVDGRALTDADRALIDHDRRRRITPYPLSDNEIGCWLSHRRALASIAGSGDAMAAVLEDDAQLAPEFASFLAALEREKPSFDFLFLHRKFKKGELFASTKALLPDLHMGRVGPAHMGAIGYIATAEGARKFLAYAPRFAHAVDKEIHRYWANHLDIFGLDRPMVTHADGGRSFIEETRDQERPKARARYPDADNLYWRLQRGLTRFRDSLQKRRAWSDIIRKRKAVDDVR